MLLTYEKQAAFEVSLGIVFGGNCRLGFISFHLPQNTIPGKISNAAGFSKHVKVHTFVNINVTTYLTLVYNLSLQKVT